MNYKIIVILIGIAAVGLILLNHVEFENPSKENSSENDEKNEKITYNPNNTEEKNENLTFKPVNLTENEKPLNLISSSSNESKKTKNESQIFWYVLNDKVLVSHELKGQENINGTKYMVVEGKMYPPVEEFYYHQKTYSPDFIEQVLPNCPPTCETTITTPEYNNYVEYIDTKTNYVIIVVIPWIASVKKNEGIQGSAITYEKLEKPSDDKSKYKYYWYNFTNYTHTKALYHMFYSIFHTPYLYLPGFINFSEDSLSIDRDNSMENFFFTKTDDEKFVPMQNMEIHGELRFLGTEIFKGKDAHHVEYVVSGKKDESGFGSSDSKITVLIDKDTKILIYAKYENEKTFECPKESRACEKMRKTTEKNRKTKEYRLLDNKEVRCKDEICEYNKRKYKYYNYSVDNNISPNEISEFEIFEINI